MKTCENCVHISSSLYRYCKAGKTPPGESYPPCPHWKEFDNQVWMQEKSRAAQREFEAAQRRQGGKS